MDIFSKIEEQPNIVEEQPNSVKEKSNLVTEQPNFDEETKNPDAFKSEQRFCGIVKSNNYFSYKYYHEANLKDSKYKYFYPSEIRYKKVGKKEKNKANKLYKILISKPKKTNNLNKIEKFERKKTKKIQKLLEKGVNFVYFSNDMKRDVLFSASSEQLYMLYEKGFDIDRKLINRYDADIVFAKKIYFAINKIDYIMLRSIPTPMLEKLIHTREGLKLDAKTQNAFLMETLFSAQSKTACNNIQLLIKTGQMGVTAGELFMLCNYIEGKGFDLMPEIANLRDYAAECQKAEKEKYANQKQITGQKQSDKSDTKTNDSNKQTTDEKKSEAKEIIDKLFEDAQNSIE